MNHLLRRLPYNNFVRNQINLHRRSYLPMNHLLRRLPYNNFVRNQINLHRRSYLLFFTKTPTLNNTGTKSFLSSSSPPQQQPRQRQHYELYVTCLPGLEPILKTEVCLKVLTHNNKEEGIKIRKGGIYFSTSQIQDILKCHLHLGTASQIYVNLTPTSSSSSNNTKSNHMIKARYMDELQRKMYHLFLPQWKSLFGRRLQKSSVVQIKVTVTSKKSKLYHTRAIQERVERAIQEASNTSTQNVTPIIFDSSQSHKKEKLLSSTDDIVTVPIWVDLKYDQVSVYLNTSTNGVPLHKRGYRLITSKAPLREDIAHGVVLQSFFSTKHPKKNNQNNNTLTIHDPFCGSGTIAIEAALILHNIPPGKLRKAPLQGTFLYEKGMWEKLINNHDKNDNDVDGDVKNNYQKQKQKTHNHLRNYNKIQIYASDRDKGAIQASISNAGRANVQHKIQFREDAISNSFDHFFFSSSSSSDQTIKDEHNFIYILTNPPYGKRIVSSSNSSTKIIKKKKNQNVDTRLLPLYQTLGNKIHILSNSKSKNNNCITVFSGIVAYDYNLVQNNVILQQQQKMKKNPDFVTTHGGLPIGIFISEHSSDIL